MSYLVEMCDHGLHVGAAALSATMTVDRATAFLSDPPPSGDLAEADEVKWCALCIPLFGVAEDNQ